MTNTEADLRRILARIDGRGYKAYKELRGIYQCSRFTLFIDYVQGDPFAAPSRLRVRMPQEIAGYPPDTYRTPSRRVGLENYLLMVFNITAQKLMSKRGSGKSGLIRIDAPGQTMLSRTAMRVTDNFVEAAIAVGLPAAGRRVLGRQAGEMLCEDLSRIVSASLRYANNSPDKIAQYTAAAEDADHLRRLLPQRGLVAFVADGALLPRRSGVDERPLTGDQVIAWQSPESLRVSVTLPNAGAVTGMGLPTGVTLIVGGGFHGKSTLLHALERGVYNHKPGDGREQVVTIPDAVKIRAEDGRSVAGVDISPFINNLPFAQNTRQFNSPNASGSTSQAANIVEALELGAKLLLIDEDTAATNFMIRDRRMQALIAREQEPITPFIDRVRQLHDTHGVSTILVIGGSGDYFDVADRVIGMERYTPQNLTKAAQAVAQQFPTMRQLESENDFGPAPARRPLPKSIDTRRGKRASSIKTRGVHTIQIGAETIDLGSVSQLVDAGQTRAIADAIQYAKERYMDGKRPLRTIVDQIMLDIATHGLETLSKRRGLDYAMFRKYELGAALNRLRTLQVKQT